MREITTEENKKIYVFQNLLPKDICSQWLEKMNTLMYTLDVDEAFSTEIFTTVKNYLGDFPIPNLMHRHEVTVGRRLLPHSEHYDNLYGNEKWKLLCYLNEVRDGGTDFKSGSEWISVEPGEGTVILFDITLFHRGSPKAERKQKFTVGIRLQPEQF